MSANGAIDPATAVLALLSPRSRGPGGMRAGRVSRIDAHASRTVVACEALRILFLGTLLLQVAIVLACVACGHANAEAGWLKHRLPQFLFWVYLWVGVGTPGIALVTLATLWAKRRRLWDDAADASQRALRHLLILCIVTVCAVPAWFALAGLVFFAAGGSR